MSSTLERNTREYGKNFMFDGCPDTCWNSDQGETQHIVVKFDQTATIHRIRIQFQGGFAARSCKVKVNNVVKDTIYPTDTNNIQDFHVNYTTSQIVLTFTEFTDFYGRLIIYLLEFDEGESPDDKSS